MPPTAICFALCALLTTVPAHARQATAPGLPGQVRDSGPAPRVPAGTSRIAGVVTLGGQPVVDARVTVSGPGLVAGRSVATDEKGWFSIASLPAGRYYVSVSKMGHSPVNYGQRTPRGRGRAVALGDGETRELKVELPRAGVITGMVLNERGEPVVGTFVRSAQVVLNNGRGAFQPGRMAESDDRGIYRLHSLPPGEYVVCAVPREFGPMSDYQRIRRELEMMQRTTFGPQVNPEVARKQMAVRRAQLEAQLAAAVPEPVVGYAPACVPGTVAAAQRAIAVGPGEERLGVDLQLERAALATIEGTLVLPPGVSAEDLFVTVTNANEALQLLGPSGAQVDPGGRFTVPNLAPGQYRLIVRTRQQGGVRRVWTSGAPSGAAVSAQPGPPALWAAADLHVDGEDVTDLTLELRPGVSITGRIAFDGTASRPQALTRLQVSAYPVPQGFQPVVLAEPAQGSIDEDGRFTITGVLPGRYRLAINVPDWTLQSALVDGRDVLDEPLEIKGGQHVAGAVLTLTDRPSEIAGTVHGEDGEPLMDASVLLYPADERHWTPDSRRVRMTGVMPDGKFTFRALPPGDYRLAAVVDVEPGAWNSPAFLQQLEAASTRVSLLEGEKKVVALRGRSD